MPYHEVPQGLHVLTFTYMYCADEPPLSAGWVASDALRFVVHPASIFYKLITPKWNKNCIDLIDKV